MRRFVLLAALAAWVGCSGAPTTTGSSGTGASTGATGATGSGASGGSATSSSSSSSTGSTGAGSASSTSSSSGASSGSASSSSGASTGSSGSSGATDAGPVDAGPADAGWVYVDAGPVTYVRIATGNLSSGNYQSYDPGEGIRIFEGLHPDVAMIQEFNYGTNSATDIREMIDVAFGPEFSYVRGASGQQIPNGIASRWPIVASGGWTDPQVSNRDFVWARIALPGGHELLAVSVHLLTSSASSRQAEATALVNDLQQYVPAGDFIALGGDFNTGTRTEACINTFSQVFHTAGPYPADQQGNGNTSAARSKPLDWVLVDPALDATEIPLQLGTSTFTNGAVFDSRVYSPLSDVSPVQSGDSAATNMQHMAVVREFAVAN